MENRKLTAEEAYKLSEQCKKEDPQKALEFLEFAHAEKPTMMKYLFALQGLQRELGLPITKAPTKPSAAESAPTAPPVFVREPAPTVAHTSAARFLERFRRPKPGDANFEEYQQSLVERYTLLIESEPSCHTHYFNRAEAYRQLKQYDDALLDLTQAMIKDDDEFAPPSRALSYRVAHTMIYCEMQDFEAAGKEFVALWNDRNPDTEGYRKAQCKKLYPLFPAHMQAQIKDVIDQYDRDVQDGVFGPTDAQIWQMRTEQQAARAHGGSSAAAAIERAAAKANSQEEEDLKMALKMSEQEAVKSGGGAMPHSEFQDFVDVQRKQDVPSKKKEEGDVYLPEEQARRVAAAKIDAANQEARSVTLRDKLWSIKLPHIRHYADTNFKPFSDFKNQDRSSEDGTVNGSECTPLTFGTVEDRAKAKAAADARAEANARLVAPRSEFAPSEFDVFGEYQVLTAPRKPEKPKGKESKSMWSAFKNGFVNAMREAVKDVANTAGAGADLNGSRDRDQDQRSRFW